VFVGDDSPDGPLDDLESLPTERLEHEIERYASHLAAGTCRWLELVAEFDRRGAWGSWGCLTCAHWLSWRCALSLRAAREHVRVAGRLEDLPLIHAEFAAGRLSYSKVRALTRVATPESQEDLLRLATHATAAQLDVLVRTYERVTRSEADDAHGWRSFSWRWEEDGSLSFHGRLPADEGALLLAAVEQARDRVFRQRGIDDIPLRPRDLPQTGEAGGSAEPRRPAGPASVTNAEALAAVAEDALRGGAASAGSPAERRQVIVHVDLADLGSADAPDGPAAEDGVAAGRCHLRDGPGIAPATARRLACDASVIGLFERDGEPLSVGRRTRSVPPSIRRALEVRDGGCRFPGCSHTRYVDAHHIRHWADGGETALDNLILLCRGHHRLLHEGGFSVRGHPGGDLTFQRPDRGPIAAAPASPGGAAAALVRSTRRRAGPAPELLTGSGEHMDLSYSLDAVFGALA
jgi:hypothetical protein